MKDGRGELSAFDIACVVIGGIVGVGIFFTPQRVAFEVDGVGMVLLAWGLGGLLAVLGAIVFAELSIHVPGHGGVFRYLDRAFGRTLAFVYGWSNWLVIQAGAAGIVALVLCDYLEQVVSPQQPWSDIGKVLGAAAVILAFTAINVLGLRVGKRVQNTLTVLKVLALVVLVVLAGIGPRTPVPSLAPVASERSWLLMLAAAMLPVLFATGGWQQGSFLAGAARHRRSVPLGILAGVAVVVVAYMLVNLAYLELLGFEGARASPAIGAAAAEAALGEAGGRILAAMVVVSAAGVLNTICLAPPYVLYAMAQHGCFPSAFGRLHARWQTPALGILGQGVWSALLLLGAHSCAAWLHGASTADTLDFIVSGVVYADWLFFTLCGVALLRLRRRDSSVGRHPLVAAVAVLFVFGAAAVTAGAVWARPAASMVGTVIVASGLLAERFLQPAAKKS